MSSLLNIGVSGLRAQQEALAVTGQNITNANTPGYSRQRAEIITQVGSVSANQFEGSGARVDNIKRVADEFATRQVRSDQALFSQMNALADQMRQIESVFFGEVAGIDQGITKFFDALHVANASPALIPDRQIVLNEAQALSDRFSSVHARLSEQFSTVRSVLEADLARVNELAVGVADLNQRINSLQNQEKGGSVNSLLDQRDVLLQEMSEYFTVSAVEESGGQVNVFIGKGQPIVLGSRASELGLDSAGEVTLKTDISTVADRVTNSLSGGEVGGLIEFRETILTDVLNRVGVLAAAVSATVNEVHAEGLDLQGEFGELMFTDINDPTLTRQRAIADIGNVPGNFVEINVAINNPLQMTGTDYSLEFSESVPGAFIIRRTSDDVLITQGVLRDLDEQNIDFDGLTVTLGAGDFHPGDRYLITPVRDLAANFSVVLEDPSKLALAAPVRLESVTDNRGNARLDVSSINDATHAFFDSNGGLVPPLQIVFTSDSTYDIMDASDPVALQQLDPPMRSLPYTPGVLNQLLPQPGDQAVGMVGTAIANLPATAVVTPNTDPVGNNYPAGVVNFQYVDPESGTLIDTQPVGFDANSSARQIAAELGSRSGVEARAVTDLTLTQLSNDGTGAPLEILVNGVSFSAPADLNELADAISQHDGLRQAGVFAKSDGSTLSLTSIYGDDLSIHVAGDPIDGVTVGNPAGDQVRLNGIVGGSYQAATVGGSVVLEMSAGVSITADAPGLFTSNPIHKSADFGFSLEMRGIPSVGDRFDVSYNANAVSDNRNGLKLSSLASAELIGEPGVTYNNAYASIVLEIGARQSEANVQRSAAQSLLDQSIATRESISGVNLDEEAANLIRLEQAYNASAQVISVARDIFDVLFQSVR